MSDLDLVMPSPWDGKDPALTVVGQVFAVDVPGRLVQVVVHETLLWLPAQPGRYRVATNTGGGLARVLLNPQTGRPTVVLGPLDPLDPVVSASMTATGATTATVVWDGSSYTLPFVPATYGGLPRDVWVALSDWGVPVLVHGPSAVAPTGGGGGGVKPPDGGGTVQVRQTIGPQWSGSFRHARDAWDRWNTNRYGGRSTLYQGNAEGSGPMVGLATYGDQLVNLGAVSIDSVRVMLRTLLPVPYNGSLTVQGTASGSQPAGAPVTGGETASGSGWVDLPSGIREAMRTGGVKGLATVGGNYAAAAGAGNGDGMQLDVVYTRPA